VQKSVAPARVSQVVGTGKMSARPVLCSPICLCFFDSDRHIAKARAAVSLQPVNRAVKEECDVIPHGVIDL
jgi:hypothetical protein